MKPLYLAAVSDHGAGALTRCSARLDSSCSARLLENLLRFPESLVKGRG